MACDRRDFLKMASWAALGAGSTLAAPAGASPRAPVPFPPATRNRAVTWRRADFQSSLPDGAVLCTLCPCDPAKAVEGRVEKGETCVCHVRANRGGVLYVSNYGRAGALHLDPLEKNPLYHFIPGASALAVAAPGCSLTCKGCQNWQLAQTGPEGVDTVDAPPAKVVSLALENRCRAISFTFSEPMMFWEYLRDVSGLAHRKGLLTTVVTGGYVCTEPVRKLSGFVDAFSVSVKAFTEADYRRYANGKYRTVLEALAAAKTTGAWLEVVVLVIPTVSDDLAKMQPFVRWVVRNLGPDTPVHFDRYWPAYRMTNVPQTPQRTLENARAMALAEGVNHAYVGNLPGHWGANTACSKCGRVLVRRVGFKVIENILSGGSCPACRSPLPGRWS